MFSYVTELPKHLMTTDELAAHLRKPPNWVAQEARAGRIPGIRVGRHWRFDPEAILRWETANSTADPLALSPRAAARRRSA